MKPKIICHMMSSVDGRLIGNRWSFPFDGKMREDLFEPYYETEKEFHIRGWLVGRNTIHEDFDQDIFDYEKYLPAKQFEIFKGKLDSSEIAIVVDSKGKIKYREDNLNGSNVIAVLSEKVSEEYLSHLRDKSISYIFAGADGYDLSKALETLNTEFGFNEILLEGGGVLNGMFLKQALIDELSLLIYPGIDGVSGMPSVIEYKGKENEVPAKDQSLELKSVTRLRDGIIWLRYQFHKAL
jgi:riboflavin biosynthesis pyrimidine reductase